MVAIRANLRGTRDSIMPPVGITNISIHPTSLFPNKKQNPHIDHPDEISVKSHSDIDEVMENIALKVELDLYVLLPINSTSDLSVLFDKDISNFIKIGMVQCLDQSTHTTIFNRQSFYLNSADGLIPTNTGDANTKKFTSFKKVKER